MMPFDSWVTDGCPVAVTNSIVLHDFPTGTLFRIPDSWYGCYHTAYDIQSTVTVEKPFNCFINRMDVFRQSWLYQLVRRGLFHQGYVSFLMDIDRLPGRKGQNPHKVFQDQYEKYCRNFHKEHEFVSKLVPYRNFTDNGDVTPICYQSKISLVLETSFDDNNVITYSEKIFRALQIPRAWLLFSHRHAVKHLVAMGFDVLDDVIDHHIYDSLDSAVERQSRILDLLSTLIDRYIDPSRLQQAARHNQSLLGKYSKTYIKDAKHTINLAATYV